MSKVRQKFIEKCVTGFIKNYPLEYVTIVSANKKRRKLLRDKKFATIDNDSAFMRLGASIPQRLHDVLDKALDNPRFLEGRELMWFLKKFPEFKIPEKL